MSERIGGFTIHPAADAYPPIPAEQHRSLVADIRAHGQLVPAVVYQGAIVDGRHRIRACVELGLTPVVQEWNGQGSLIDYVISLNLRRDMNASQRALVAVALEALAATDAKGRQRDHGGTAPGKRKSLVAQMPQVIPRKARDDAAAVHGVSPRYVQDAKRIQAEAPEKVERIRAGDLTITQAVRELKRATTHERIRAAAAPPLDMAVSRRFPVLYADPPWQYESGSIDESRVIENQYPTMTLDAIKAMTVPALDDAVLFLWATSPKLAEALEVVTAWGFRYRTCAVWTKPRIGMGYYFRQQHELLLVATRGALPVPEPSARIGSIFATTTALRHSEKPASVRDAIVRMYPDLPRIELFARARVAGWDAWGNEVAA